MKDIVTRETDYEKKYVQSTFNNFRSDQCWAIRKKKSTTILVDIVSGIFFLKYIIYNTPCLLDAFLTLC